MCGVELRSHQSHVTQWAISQTGWTARVKVGRFTHLNAIQTHRALTGNEDIKKTDKFPQVTNDINSAEKHHSE